MRSRKVLTSSSFSVILLFYLLLSILVVVILAGGTSIIALGNVPAEGENVSDRCATHAPGA